jgi:aminopeptidase N
VLQPERFDYALRQYAERWAFRRATPWDLFRTFSDATGEDLSWFWHGWFATTWTIDLAVAEVSSPNPSAQQGARLTLRLKTPFPMPVRARVEEADGTHRTIHLPADVWRDGPTHTVQLDTDAPLRRVVLDPDGVVPDIQPADNSWSAGDGGAARGGT